MLSPATAAVRKPAPKSHPTPPVVREGANGKTVSRLQTLLKSNGANPGPVDGAFGPKTKAAVKEFQREHRLEQSGVVGPKTWSALTKAESARTEVFTPGDCSAKIKSAESRLKQLGYDTGAVDGMMDAKTSKAVSAFRKDQGLGSNGQLTTTVRSALSKEAAGFNHAAYRGRRRDTVSLRRLDALTAKEAAKTQGTGPGAPLGIGEGAKGRAVSNVQARLQAAGFDPKSTRGTFDERTAGAVKAFQKRSGLQQTGRVDSGTWKQLSKSFIKAKNATSPAQALNEKSGAVKSTEKRLRKLGYKGVKVDGLFDRATQRAVKAFENKTKGLATDGKVGARDIAKMKGALKAKSTKTVAGCAQFLLQSKNVSFWSGLSSGSDRKNVERLAKGLKAKVPATGGQVKPSLKLMQALVAMAKKGKIMINALTGGTHSVGSNHYRGVAVDLDVSTGNAGMIESTARKYGGVRNFERDHIHLDF